MLELVVWKVLRMEERYEIYVSELSKVKQMRATEGSSRGLRRSGVGLCRQFRRWESKCVGQGELGKE